MHIPLTAAAGMRREELDAVIDIVRTSAEAEVAVVAKQVDPDTWQVSLRSHGALDVAAVAVHARRRRAPAGRRITRSRAPTQH